jgi:hypothetical protein
MYIKSVYEKKSDFLAEKCREAFCGKDATLTIKALYAELNGAGITLEGFTTLKQTWGGPRPNTYEETYRITNASKNGCYLCFLLDETKGAKPKFMTFSTYINGISNEFAIRDGSAVYNFLSCLEKIEKELLVFAAEVEKGEKIRNIAADSVQTWVETLLNGTAYSYYTEETNEHKTTLYIKLKNKMHLNIPIYYKSFQKTIPILLETIQLYEKTVQSGKLKVLIEDSHQVTKWKTPTKRDL